MSRTDITVTTSGFFFTGNPVGYVHIAMYADMKEVTEVGASAAANALSVGHGVLGYSHNVVWKSAGLNERIPSGYLRDSIEPRLVKASRGRFFKSRGVVVQGARGYEPVRVFGWKIDKKYHYMNAGARAAQSYADAHASAWASGIARGLNRE